MRRKTIEFEFVGQQGGLALDVAELEIIRVEEAIEFQFHPRVIVARVPEGARIRLEVEGRLLICLLRRVLRGRRLCSPGGAAAFFPAMAFSVFRMSLR